MGIGPKNRVAEPVTGAAALVFMAAAVTNQDWASAAGYAILAVIPWFTSWLADKARAK
jgi:hypothetical protein